MFSLITDMSRYKKATILMVEVMIRFRSRITDEDGIEQRQVEVRIIQVNHSYFED